VAQVQGMHGVSPLQRGTGSRTSLPQ
jgi:hypothetical protein